MSKKRFVIDYDLDDLEEENVKLRAKIEEQQDTIGEQKIAIDELITDYKKLEKENEQLQKELEKVKLLNESLGLFANE